MFRIHTHSVALTVQAAVVRTWYLEMRAPLHLWIHLRSSRKPEDTIHGHWSFSSTKTLSCTKQWTTHYVTSYWSRILSTRKALGRHMRELTTKSLIMFKVIPTTPRAKIASNVAASSSRGPGAPMALG